MTENIVIEFTSNTEGITTASQAVESLDKSNADQFTKTNASLKERQTLIDKNVAGLAQYAQKVQDAGKAAAGAFSAKGLQDYDATVKKVSQSIETLRAKALVRQELLIKETDVTKIAKYNKEIEDLTKEMQQLSNAGKKGFDDLGNPIESSEGKVQSLKARLRELKQELATIDDPNDPKFRAMSIEAAELQDRISDVSQQINLLSSDTRNFDAGIQAIQGVAGAFAVAQGAMALFGNENDEIQKTLLKVNAAMSIMQGLQQVGALLDKNSALNIFLLKTLRLQQAASTTAVAVAEGEAVVATEALAAADTQATVAQQGLNAAMAANPAGVLLLSLATLVGLIEIFIGDTDKAAKAQEHLNDQIKEGIKWNNSNVEEVEKAGKVIEADYKKRNASAKDLRELNVRVLQEQIKTAQSFEDKNRQAYDQADQRLRDHQNNVKKLSNDEYKANSETVNLFNDVQRKRFALEDQLQLTQISNETENFKERLKNQTAFVDAQVLKTREGSRNELIAQIDAIRAKEQEDLQSEAKLPGEIAQIRAQADRDVQKKRLEIRVFDLNQEKLYADAKLQKSVEGSQEELNARVKLLRVSANLEIAQAIGNAAKITDIKAKEARDEFELIRTYNRKIQDDKLKARVAATNSELSKLSIAGADATNEELLLAKQKLVTQEADIERQGVKDSIDTAGNKLIRLKEIDDKELADKKELERQKASAEISGDESYFSAYYQLQISRAQRRMDNDKASYSSRKQAVKDFYNYSIDSITSQLAFEKDRLDQHLITQKEYDTKELQLLNEKEALKTQLVKNAEAERQAIQDKSFALVSTLASGYFSMLSDQYNYELAQTQDLADKKLITQQEADKRTRDIKRKQAADEKANALFTIALQTAQNLIKDHLNPFLIGLDLAAFAAQSAFILAKQPPAYRYGEVNIDGPGTSTSDSILARISRGESVITASATQKWEPALNAINNDTFEAWLANFKPAQPIEYPSMSLPQFEMPTMGALPKWAEHATQNISIDYDLLAAKVGKMVAKHVGRIEDLPTHDITIDKSGIHIIAKEGLDRTEFLNNKYSFKRK